eukprot:Rhum_TRINITY_DN14999_c1_g1::Rhum_TRINITY_DN14999_c1_g1_i2::g.132179::m.132179
MIVKRGTAGKEAEFGGSDGATSICRQSCSVIDRIIRSRPTKKGGGEGEGEILGISETLQKRVARRSREDFPTSTFLRFFFFFFFFFAKIPRTTSHQKSLHCPHWCLLIFFIILLFFFILDNVLLQTSAATASAPRRQLPQPSIACRHRRQPCDAPSRIRVARPLRHLQALRRRAHRRPRHLRRLQERLGRLAGARALAATGTVVVVGIQHGAAAAAATAAAHVLGRAARPCAARRRVLRRPHEHAEAAQAPRRRVLEREAASAALPVQRQRLRRHVRAEPAVGGRVEVRRRVGAAVDGHAQAAEGTFVAARGHRCAEAAQVARVGVGVRRVQRGGGGGRLLVEAATLLLAREVRQHQRRVAAALPGPPLLLQLLAALRAKDEDRREQVEDHLDEEDDEGGDEEAGGDVEQDAGGVVGVVRRRLEDEARRHDQHVQRQHRHVARARVRLCDEQQRKHAEEKQRCGHLDVPALYVVLRADRVDRAQRKVLAELPEREPRNRLLERQEHRCVPLHPVLLAVVADPLAGSAQDGQEASPRLEVVVDVARAARHVALQLPEHPHRDAHADDEGREAEGAAPHGRQPNDQHHCGQRQALEEPLEDEERRRREEQRRLRVVVQRDARRGTQGDRRVQAGNEQAAHQREANDDRKVADNRARQQVVADLDARRVQQERELVLDVLEARQRGNGEGARVSDAGRPAEHHADGADHDHALLELEVPVVRHTAQRFRAPDALAVVVAGLLALVPCHALPLCARSVAVHAPCVSLARLLGHTEARRRHNRHAGLRPAAVAVGTRPDPLAPCGGVADPLRRVRREAPLRHACVADAEAAHILDARRSRAPRARVLRAAVVAASACNPGARGVTAALCAAGVRAVARRFRAGRAVDAAAAVCRAGRRVQAAARGLNAASSVQTPQTARVVVATGLRNVLCRAGRALAPCAVEGTPLVRGTRVGISDVARARCGDATLNAVATPGAGGIGVARRPRRTVPRCTAYLGAAGAGGPAAAKVAGTRVGQLRHGCARQSARQAGGGVVRIPRTAGVGVTGGRTRVAARTPHARARATATLTAGIRGARSSLAEGGAGVGLAGTLVDAPHARGVCVAAAPRSMCGHARLRLLAAGRRCKPCAPQVGRTIGRVRLRGARVGGAPRGIGDPHAGCRRGSTGALRILHACNLCAGVFVGIEGTADVFLAVRDGAPTAHLRDTGSQAASPLATGVPMTSGAVVIRPETTGRLTRRV